MKNPFERKYIEKILFSACKPQAMDRRRCRTYLRKLARNVEKAWEIGRRDGLDGKPLVPLEELLTNDDSPLERKIIRLTYTAYQSGHLAGIEKGREV